MARTTPITVELSAKDRQLIRELIAAVKDAQIGAILSDAGVEPEDMADAKAGVKRLIETDSTAGEKVMPLGMLPRSITEKMERDQQEFLDRMQQMGQAIASASEPKTSLTSERSQGGFAEAARAEVGKFPEAASSLWNATGPIYWGDEPEANLDGR